MPANNVFLVFRVFVVEDEREEVGFCEAPWKYSEPADAATDKWHHALIIKP